ncbi:hypothetical protein Y032_0102g3467 [Ancylostoma ceylanicum]|uniref:Uncharacterized protein n=1 Tax=Ancylostoma ceylanicum TaxID=53326 RepID=A0A016THM0_9BILA|nr:hypothetical protein Y032_0102g3467 [Ancylostoma ceylanicum]
MLRFREPLMQQQVLNKKRLWKAAAPKGFCRGFSIARNGRGLTVIPQKWVKEQKGLSIHTITKAIGS